jgi:hypothetical protein
MTFLALLSKLPGRDTLIAKAVEPIHRAANAITLRDYAGTRPPSAAPGPHAA